MNHDNRFDRPDEKDGESQITEMLEQLDIEKAPASLTRRLKRIPREERRRNRQGSWQFPRWAMAPAFAAIPLLVLVAVLMQERQPSEGDVEQARQDLTVAFSYLDKVGNRTGNEIQAVLGGELRHNVKGNLSKHLPFTEQSRKEETT